MRVLFTTCCKPIPVLLGKFLSADDVTYRFVADQGLFSISAHIPYFPLHFLAQNINVPSVVLEWPTKEELIAELKSEKYDYVGITFKCMDLYTVAEMIEIIRDVSPDTKIVLGGYGTLALNEPGTDFIRDRVDYICRGEGVQFMRLLVGDDVNRPKICHLPPEVISIPWLSVSTRVGYILSALGCAGKCEFCSTSAYTVGEVIEVMTPAEIYESMRWYFDSYPDFSQVYMMDENFLLRQDKVNALGELIRNDDRYGLSRLNYLAFGTILATGKWDPDELLLNGVSQIWMGVESFYSYSIKKEDVNIPTLVQTLKEHGIEIQLSWIIGDDCQTPENIDRDVDQLVALGPCTTQLAVLSASPGTALYKRLKEEGRIRPFDPKEGHLLGNNMNALHFTHEERLKIVFDTYRQVYETHGPSMMRSLEVQLNGYRHCLNSKNPYLNGPKLEYFKKEIRNTIPFTKMAAAFAPNEKVRNLMLDLEKEYVELLGPFRKTQRIAADHILKLAEKEMKRRETEGYSPLVDEPPLHKYVYHGEPIVR
jgi:haloalkane dehalogenase